MNDVAWYIAKGLTHELHTSERKSFRGCRRRWAWIFRDMYYPTVTARPLEFGVACHVAFQTYYGFYLGLYKNPDPDAATQLAVKAFKDTTYGQLQKYIELNQGIDPEMRADYEDRVKVGVGMLNHYFRNVSPAEDEGLKPLKVEIPFEVPITGPNGETLWCKCAQCFRKWMATDPGEWREGNWSSPGEYHKAWIGLPVTYGGRIDCLMEDSQGRYWIYDWKTTARLSIAEAGSTDDFMWLDDQITSYCWAMWKIGIPVVGFIYAEIKKAFPVEPDMNKVVRLGRMFSVSKQIDTTPEIYRRTVQENDPEAYEDGLYDDFIRWLETDGPKFHKRHEIMRNQSELIEAGLNIWQEACDIVNPNLMIYPNPGRFHCDSCAFREPCIGKNRGEDYQYTLETLFEKRTKHYWETAPPSTDKRMGQM